MLWWVYRGAWLCDGTGACGSCGSCNERFQQLSHTHTDRPKAQTMMERMTMRRSHNTYMQDQCRHSSCGTAQPLSRAGLATPLGRADCSPSGLRAHACALQAINHVQPLERLRCKAVELLAVGVHLRRAQAGVSSQRVKLGQQAYSNAVLRCESRRQGDSLLHGTPVDRKRLGRLHAHCHTGASRPCTPVSTYTEKLRLCR